MPPAYGAEEIAAIAARILLDPPALLDADPYATPEIFPGEPDAYCGVIPDTQDDQAYRLQTFSNLDTLAQASATLTHHGACGQCSSLQDLAVYMANTELTGPVRRCGLADLLLPDERVIACIKNIGFTDPCAQIWFFNTKKTRSACLGACLLALNQPFHDEEGNLNACIQCDEDISGPVFKAVSGRTRRNSGLPSALCRPCESVAPVTHVYP